MRKFSIYCVFIFAVDLSWGQFSGSPVVNISFPDVGDQDYQNETLAVITNSNPDFEMLCTAAYPVEWILHYSPDDDGISEQTKRAETRRHAEKFENDTSYTFTATLRMAYRGNLLVLTNYTCQKAGEHNGEKRTHVIMTYFGNEKSLINLEITNDHNQIVSPLLKLQEGTSNKNVCKRAEVFVRTPPPGRGKFGLQPCSWCEEPGTKKELHLDYHSCMSPIQCENTLAPYKKGKMCLHEFNTTSPPNHCKFNGLVEFNPLMVLCKNRGSALTQFYFFGVYRGASKKDHQVPAPPVYFDWNEVDQSKMLYIHPLAQKQVYRGENITITCEYSRFYFSLGSWFGIFSDGVMQYTKANDTRPCNPSVQNPPCTEGEEWRGTYVATWSTTFEQVGTHRAYCFGPVWNTTAWVNDSLEFNVVEGDPPKVISLEPDGNSEFIVGEVDRALVCTYKGLPNPTVKWTWEGSSNESQYRVVPKDNYTSAIVFYEIGYKTTGEYTCEVSSFLGKHFKTFKLKSASAATLSTAAIIAISLSVVVVIALIGFVIWRMRRIILAQQEELRLLTEVEIDEFIMGNPDLLRAEKNAYFNTTTAIEALPYDGQYEVPRDKLSIEYTKILGAGEFGVVHKGKIDASSVAHYIQLSERNRGLYVNFHQSGQLEVAIKICKVNMDVGNFKALLSEIKVMAYLGTHENIVSLVGASTSNIKNRELYIALEFCQNGSLDKYLRQRKQNFAQCQDEAEDCVTPDKLLAWTHDIATGLEYIHSKKVGVNCVFNIIHADLAIRNILLTTSLSAKIGDFGLSRQLVDSSSYIKTTKCALPWRNMAIESLRKLEYSVHSDIWAFGVTLWELFTLGDLPYPGLNYTVEFVELLESGLRLYKPPLASSSMYEYMLLCWTIEPSDRPSSGDVKMICAKEMKNP